MTVTVASIHLATVLCERRCATALPPRPCICTECKIAGDLEQLEPDKPTHSRKIALVSEHLVDYVLFDISLPLVLKILHGTMGLAVDIFASHCFHAYLNL